MSAQKISSIAAALLFLVTWGAPRAFAQSETRPSPEELQNRIRQLETQLEVVRGELNKLKQSVSEETPVQTANTGQPKAAPVSPLSTAAKQDERPAKAEESPIGINLGPVRATPYGTIFFNAFGNSGGTNNADVPLFATSGGQGSVSATARQTRLGLRLEGPKVKNAKLSGALEADFYGGFPSIGIGESFGVVRLRLAFARLDWQHTSLTAGQDWMVFAPVNPSSLASAAIPQLATSGNPWMRLPQLRLERRWQEGRLSWQGAVLSPATGDFPSGTNSPALLQPGIGAAAKLPFFQSRVAWSEKNWLNLKKPGSVGLSAHYGRARVTSSPTANHRIDSVGLALDWNFPVLTRLTLAGETFFGRNLAGFQSAVFQGYNPEFAYRRGSALIAGGPRAIGTRGGWAQVGFTPPVFADRLTAYASYGIDDPRDEDLVSLTKREWRVRNEAYALNFLYKLTPQLSWGLEYRRQETDYVQAGKQANNHLNLGAAFSF